MSRGGRRNGAGRPKNTTLTTGVKYTLPKEVHKTIKFLGGSFWILTQVNKYLNDKK